MTTDLPASPRLRDLKSAAQRLEPLLWIGKSGATPAFLAALDQALGTHELVKVKFEAFKDQKKLLAPDLAERTHSRLVLRVGNVAVYHRARAGAPPAEPRRPS